MKKVAIVIPAYNEEERISKVLRNYLDYFENLELDFKIVVVLNACKDNTRGVVESFKSKNIEILEFERGGKGFAIVQGFRWAISKKYELMGFIDADCSTPANAFYGLVRHLDNFDGIIADRWDKRSLITPKQSLFRLILSRGYNFIVRSLFLFNYRDTQCGAKLFRGELLMKMIDKLDNSEWGFDVDVLFYARRENAQIKSIPTEWHDEVGSKVNLKKTPITMFLASVRLRLYHSPFKFLIRCYNILPEKLKFHKIF